MVWVFRRLKGLSFGLAWLDLTGDGPDKAGEFAGDGSDGDLGFLFTRAGKMDVAMMQTALRFPGDVGDGLGQTFLAFFQVGTHPRRGTILPGGLDEGAAGDGVAGFGDAALAAFIARGVLAGNQAQIVHQLGGMGEAVEVAEFGDEGGGVEEGESPQRHQSPDNGLPTPAGHGPGDFHVVTFEAVGGLGDAIKHFLEGDLLDGKGQLEFGEVTEMGRGPGGLSGVTEVMAEEKHF